VTRPLRVAVLGRQAGAADLAGALSAAGQRPVLLWAGAARAPAGVEAIRLRGLLEAPLEFRSIGDGLGHLPHAWFALARGGFEVAHAFAPADALPAVAWARRSHRPVVLTFTTPLSRATIANRRLRLATVERAVQGVDAVLAADEEVRRSLRRLLALEAPVVAPGDAAGHLALYRELLGASS